MNVQRLKNLIDSFVSINEGRSPEKGEPTAVMYLGGHSASVSISCFYEGFNGELEDNGESFYIRLDDQSSNEDYYKALAQLEYTALLNRRFKNKEESYKESTLKAIEVQYAETIKEIEARYDRRLREVEKRLKCVGL